MAALNCPSWSWDRGPVLGRGSGAAQPWHREEETLETSCGQSTAPPGKTKGFAVPGGFLDRGLLRWSHRY